MGAGRAPGGTDISYNFSLTDLCADASAELGHVRIEGFRSVRMRNNHQRPESAIVPGSGEFNPARRRSIDRGSSWCSNVYASMLGRYVLRSSARRDRLNE